MFSARSRKRSSVTMRLQSWKTWSGLTSDSGFVSVVIIYWYMSETRDPLCLATLPSSRQGFAITLLQSLPTISVNLLVYLVRLRTFCCGFSSSKSLVINSLVDLTNSFVDRVRLRPNKKAIFEITRVHSSTQRLIRCSDDRIQFRERQWNVCITVCGVMDGPHSRAALQEHETLFPSHCRAWNTLLTFENKTNMD